MPVAAKKNNRWSDARHWATALIAACCFLTVIASAEDLEPTVLEEVLVKGEQPGPGLWRISKDDHSLWILGTFAPLPKDMTWRSKAVEDILAESQEVISPVQLDVDTDIGFFKALTLLPALLNSTKNPDDAKLQDVVPADVYARWLPLKAKYIGSNKGIEKWRPTFAAGELQTKAHAKAGFATTSDTDKVVRQKVMRLAKQHKIKIASPTVKLKLEVDNPRQMLKNFRKVHLPDVECFDKTLQRLEPELEIMKARANAWATGDVQTLRERPIADKNADCMVLLNAALTSGTLAEEMGGQEMLTRIKQNVEIAAQAAAKLWLAVAEKSLAENQTSFALLPIDDLLGDKGYLSQLRAAGYTIEEP